MNAIEFTKKFAQMSNAQQQLTIKKLESRERKLQHKHEQIIDGILEWCKVNAFLGNELCSPNTIDSFLR